VVRVKLFPTDKQWQKAIVETQVSPRSYIIRTKNMKRYRRNRKDLIKTNE